MEENGVKKSVESIDAYSVWLIDWLCTAGNTHSQSINQSMGLLLKCSIACSHYVEKNILRSSASTSNLRPSFVMSEHHFFNFSDKEIMTPHITAFGGMFFRVHPVVDLDGDPSKGEIRAADTDALAAGKAHFWRFFSEKKFSDLLVADAAVDFDPEDQDILYHRVKKLPGGGGFKLVLDVERIPADLLPLMIGKSGAGKKNIEDETKTRITFPDKSPQHKNKPLGTESCAQRPFDWLIDRWMDWLVDVLLSWLIDWFISRFPPLDWFFSCRFQLFVFILTEIMSHDDTQLILCRRRLLESAQKARFAVPFTHFLNFPVTAPAIKQSFDRFRDSVIQKCGGVSGLYYFSVFPFNVYVLLFFVYNLQLLLRMLSVEDFHRTCSQSPPNCTWPSAHWLSIRRMSMAWRRMVWRIASKTDFGKESQIFQSFVPSFIDWSVDCLIDWLVTRLVDWLIDWLIVVGGKNLSTVFSN